MRKWGEIMANIKSAKKRISVIETKTAQNRRIKDRIKSISKDFEEALANGDMQIASEKLTLLEKKYMRAASKNVFHKKNASRKVSKLRQRFNKAQAN